MLKPRHKIFLLALCVVVLFSSSCSHLPPKNQPSIPVEDLHIYEEVSYAMSPFQEAVGRTFLNNTHYINILNVGDEALLARIHLIRQAQKALYVQTFIWTDDESGRLAAKELIAAAERGVQVKILIDYLTVEKNFNLLSYLATAHENIELKIYNPIAQKIQPSTLNIFKSLGVDFIKTNKRMHNKIIVMDDRVGITGGRNFENDYFDRGYDRNFKDRDVLVVGPAVKTMTDSFMDYWGYRLVVAADDMVDISSLTEKRRADDNGTTRPNFDLGGLFEELSWCAGKRACVKETLVDKGFDVAGDVEFVYDRPGKNERIGKYLTTTVANSLLVLLAEAKDSVIMQTPYLIVQRKWSSIFSRIRRNNPGIEILVSSNSLAAADHVHAYAFSFKNKKKYLKAFKWRIFEFKPAPADADQMIKPITAAKRAEGYYACIHAKSYIFDDKVAWIGSFNIDPRSKNLNTEAGLVINDKHVAAALKEDILRDMAPQNSWTIGKTKDIPVVSRLSDSIDDVMDVVPFVHVWPFRYTSSFELKQGKEEVPFYHEDFYKNYDSVGPFPQMELSIAEIEARLLKSFFGVVEGLM